MKSPFHRVPSTGKHSFGMFSRRHDETRGSAGATFCGMFPRRCRGTRMFHRRSHTGRMFLRGADGQMGPPFRRENIPVAWQRRGNIIPGCCPVATMHPECCTVEPIISECCPVAPAGGWGGLSAPRQPHVGTFLPRRIQGPRENILRKRSPKIVGMFPRRPDGRGGET